MLIDLRKGDVAQRQDISYAQDPKNGWVLSGWKSVSMRGGQLAVDYEATITEFRINPHLDDKECYLEFPAGTWVSDMNTDKIYIQRAGGQKRLVTAAELAGGATYDQLIHTESGKAFTYKGKVAWPWLLWTNVAVVVVLGTLLLLRWRGRRARRG